MQKTAALPFFTIREKPEGGGGGGGGRLDAPPPPARVKTSDSVQCGFDAWYEHMSPTSTDSPGQVATAASSVSGCTGWQLPLPPHPRRVHERLRRCSD